MYNRIMNRLPSDGKCIMCIVQDLSKMLLFQIREKRHKQPTKITYKIPKNVSIRRAMRKLSGHTNDVRKCSNPTMQKPQKQNRPMQMRDKLPDREF